MRNTSYDTSLLGRSHVRVTIVCVGSIPGMISLFLVWKRLEGSRSQQCMARGEPRISLLQSQRYWNNSGTYVLV